VKFITDHEVREIIGDGKVEAVLLDNGLRVSADLVLAGVGVHPATEACVAAEGERPVTASRRRPACLRRAVGNWRYRHVPLSGQPQRIEHWRLAQQHARIAAANMLGADEHYLDVPFFWTWHFGRNYDYLGHASQWDEIEFRANPSIRRSSACSATTAWWSPRLPARRNGPWRCSRSG
jgi:NADPH-dependent 2,4-dienoyl-CoA reductase/sulfur reductase-like enzyme